MRAGNRSASISRQTQHGPGTERWSPVPAPGIGYWEPSSAPMRRRQDGGRGGAAGPIPCPSCPCLLPGSCRHFFKSQLVSGWFLFFSFNFVCVCVCVCVCVSFLGCTCSIWTFPGYGSNESRSRRPRSSQSNARSEIQAASGTYTQLAAPRDP